MSHGFNIFQFVVANVFLINLVLAVLLVFFERRDPTTTWLWLMIFLFLPGVGFVLYLFIGQDLRKKKMFKLKEEEDRYIKGRVETQERNIQDKMLDFKDPRVKQYEDIIKLHLISNEAIYTQDNEMEIYYNGVDKFNALLSSIRRAKKYIHMEYYIYRGDNIGKEIMEALLEKAKEGVEVKLLYDGMGGRKLPRNFFGGLKAAGGKVAVFFPPFAEHLSPRINYRNHRKICIVDGEEAFVGGFNIGDEYLGLSKKFGFWRDTHCKIKGSAVYGLQWRFLQDWRFAFKEKLDSIEKYFPVSEGKGDIGIQIVSSGPDSTWSSVKDGYFKMIANSTKKVYIQTPYFIPDDSIFEALRISALSGVDVRVMLPGKPDHPFVYWAGFSYIGELLQAGVKFYIYKNGFLHSKVVLMDDMLSSIGSANLDIRSFKLNFEVNAFIYDEKVNKEVERQFIEDLKYCKEVTIEEYKKRPWWVKFKESISRLLSPIL